MANSSEIRDLINRLNNLEIHAAHSGRLVLNILINFIENNEALDGIEILKSTQHISASLLAAIPPYAPPINSINKINLMIENLINSGSDVKAIKEKIIKEPIIQTGASIQEQIAKRFISELGNRKKIYTHTLSETVLGMLLNLKDYMPEFEVIVSESRPNNDGWITASKLAEAGIQTKITIDMEFQNAIDASDIAISGTEIINSDGSVVCKVGTLPIANYCKASKKNFYIIGGLNKICPIHSNNFPQMKIKLHDMGIQNKVEKLTTFGNFFDFLPASLISGYVTEAGLFTQLEIEKEAKELKVSKWLQNYYSKEGCVE